MAKKIENPEPIRQAQGKQSRRVLVVDDEESILDAVKLILDDEGYSVKAIFKGDEVYKEVETFKPDLILLDVLMSGKDGRIICKNLKTNPDTKDIPIIMISAHPSANETMNDYKADDFLPKPFRVDELLDILNKYLN